MPDESLFGVRRHEQRVFLCLGQRQSCRRGRAAPSGFSGNGCIAATTTTQFVLVDYQYRVVYQTQDAGATWTKSPPSLPAAGWQSIGIYSAEGRQIVAADHVNVGTLYLYATGAGGRLSVD